jgi:hypothetical protein
MIILTSMHVPIETKDVEYIQKVSDVSWFQNKVNYANKHNYLAISRNRIYNIPVGFEKIIFIYELLNNIPQCSWIWWTGGDTLITNHTIRVEDKILQVPNDKHIIMSGDFNFIINCDSMLIRNSLEARNWLKSIIDSLPTYGSNKFLEQQYMIDTYEENKSIIQLQPQRFMNSYDGKHYGTDKNGNSVAAKDVNGNEGIWQPGDWLIHFPGLSWQLRWDLIQEYNDKVIYE